MPSRPSPTCVFFHDQPFLAVLALDDPRRPIAEFRVHVLVPEIERLEDMTVGIDDIVLVTQDPSPLLMASTGREILADASVAVPMSRGGCPGGIAYSLVAGR